MVAALGALKLGAVVVPFNNRFTPDELRYLVDDSGPAMVLADDANRDRMAAALARPPAASGAVALRPLGAFTGLRHERVAPVPRPAAGPDDVTQIVYTSGTSSRPKGVLFTHRSTFNLIADFAFAEPALRPGARIIYVLSMSGAPGLLWHFLHPLTRGLSIFYERGFEPARTLRRLAEAKIQIMAGVPVLFEQMAKLPAFADADLSALELVTIAGARAPVPVIRAWLDKGVLLRQAYGMTELGGISSLNPAEQAVNRPESVGRGTVFTRHRVVRPDGTDCDPEEPGEIIVSGPGVTPGYWRNEAAYADAMRDNWFHSGDVGVKDADGYHPRGRPAQGHHHHRRVQRGAVGDRGGDQRAARGHRGVRGLGGRRQVRRGTGGRHLRPGSHHGRGGHRALPGAPGRLQGTPARDRPGPAARADGERQDRPAQDQGRAPRARGDGAAGRVTRRDQLRVAEDRRPGGGA